MKMFVTRAPTLAVIAAQIASARWRIAAVGRHPRPRREPSQLRRRRSGRRCRPGACRIPASAQQRRCLRRASNLAGRAEPCDELTSEWSEQLLRSSIPTTTQYRITDPVGAGNQTVTIPGPSQRLDEPRQRRDLTVDGSSATWAASLLVLNSSGDALTARISGACTGTGCSALAVVHNVTVTYVPAATITDAAGNPAGGSFVKTQTMY